MAAAIVDAAAGVLASRGEQASMSDVAAAAGVGRATVYRYFPNRQALLEALAAHAMAEAASRLEAARLDDVPVEEGVARAVRALVDVGDPFLVLARERVRPEPQQYERSVLAPLRRLVERAQASGDLRTDVPAAWLTESLVSLVVGVLGSVPSAGREDTSAAVTGLFLHGALDRRPRSRDEAR